jgi:MtN3 and saliva related transmembrane protein
VITMTDLASLAPSIVGSVAAVCSMVSFVPQIMQIIKKRDASTVSFRMYVVTVTGFACWITYGVLIKSWPVVGSNTVCLVLSAVILVLKLRYSKRGSRSSGQPAHEPA